MTFHMAGTFKPLLEFAMCQVVTRTRRVSAGAVVTVAVFTESYARSVRGATVNSTSENTSVGPEPSYPQLLRPWTS